MNSGKDKNKKRNQKDRGTLLSKTTKAEISSRYMKKCKPLIVKTSRDAEEMQRRCTTHNTDIIYFFIEEEEEEEEERYKI